MRKAKSARGRLRDSHGIHLRGGGVGAGVGVQVNHDGMRLDGCARGNVHAIASGTTATDLYVNGRGV